MVSILTCSKHVMWLVLSFILTIFGKILNWKIKKNLKKNVSLFKKCTVYEYSFDQIVNYENGTKFKNGDQNKHRSSSLKCKDLFGCQIIEILVFIFIISFIFLLFILLSFNCPANMLNINSFHKIEIIFLFRLAPVSKIYHNDELNK